jgi:hypothetical protein
MTKLVKRLLSVFAILILVASPIFICGVAYADTFTLTYLAGDNGSISGDTPRYVEQGEDGSPVEAVPDNDNVS